MLCLSNRACQPASILIPGGGLCFLMDNLCLPWNIYSDDKTDVCLPIVSLSNLVKLFRGFFQFQKHSSMCWLCPSCVKWYLPILKMWILKAGKNSFEIWCCSSCGCSSIDIFIDIEFITMKWHFGLRAKFISIFTIMFEFIILTISLPFCSPSPCSRLRIFQYISTHSWKQKANVEDKSNQKLLRRSGWNLCSL